MTRHLAKLLDAIWYLSMGLFLGLTAGLVLSVILTFRGARAIDATPGVEPYSDPMFAAYHNDAVAGYIGQDLFRVGGTVALVLLGVGVLARIGHGLALMRQSHSIAGYAGASLLRGIALFLCVCLMLAAALHTRVMNATWPDLYNTSANESQLMQSRKDFETSHQISESITRFAWISGLFALVISPWCRRIADDSSQTAIEKQK